MKKKLKKMCVPVLVMGAVFILFRFVLFIGYVPTESMEPTIPRGNYILGTRIFGELEVGDVIVFRHEGRLLVKRIKAVSGDIVTHKGKKLVVPDKCLYVVGDNKGVSIDSRYLHSPFISLDEVKGIYEPFSQNPYHLPPKT